MGLLRRFATPMEQLCMDIKYVYVADEEKRPAANGATFFLIDEDRFIAGKYSSGQALPEALGK